jgi:hypothetical protein
MIVVFHGGNEREDDATGGRGGGREATTAMVTELRTREDPTTEQPQPQPDVLRLRLLIEGEFQRWGADLGRFLEESRNNGCCPGSTSLAVPSGSPYPSQGSPSSSLEEGREEDEEKALLAWLTGEGDRRREAPPPPPSDADDDDDEGAPTHPSSSTGVGAWRSVVLPRPSKPPSSENPTSSDDDDDGIANGPLGSGEGLIGPTTNDRDDDDTDSWRMHLRCLGVDVMELECAAPPEETPTPPPSSCVGGLLGGLGDAMGAVDLEAIEEAQRTLEETVIALFDAMLSPNPCFFGEGGGRGRHRDDDIDDDDDGYCVRISANKRAAWKRRQGRRTTTLTTTTSKLVVKK